MQSPKRHGSMPTYLTMPDNDDQAICSFTEFGERCIPAEIVSSELPAQVKALEQFVCHVYDPKGPITLPSLKWKPFGSQNLKGELIPPTTATLLFSVPN